MMISVPVASALPPNYFREILSRTLLLPVAVSGSNIYAAWNNASALSMAKVYSSQRVMMVEKRLQRQWFSAPLTQIQR